VPTQPVTDPVYVPENHPDVAIFAAGPSACCGIDPLDPYANVNRTNPDNGGLREVQWWGRILGAGTPQNNDLKPFEKWSTRAGLRGSFNDTWDYTLSYVYSIEETSAFRKESVKKELQNALYGRGGPDRNEFYRFAWDTRDQNSQGLMDTILGFWGYDAQATQKVFDGIVSGEFGSMGGGAIGAAFGVQWREDTLMYDYNNPSEAFIFTFFVGGADFDVSQSSTAVFGELAFPFTEDLELNIAARWEEIEEESTVDPKVSFLFTPTEEWSVRASWGTSFRVPTLFTSGGENFNAGAGTDPVIGQPITYRARFATDPSTPVVPQEADTWNVGATYSGENGLTASLDYWNFEYDGFIVYESQGAVLATDPLGPQVLRDPSGNVIEVTGFASNAGFLNTSGIDFSISYAIDTGSGTFTPFLDSTYMLEYEIDDPQWGPLDALGWANTWNVGSAAVEARANIGVRWENDKHSANIYARYIDSFLSDESSDRLGGPITTTDSGGSTVLDPANFLPVESHTTIDAQYAYRSDSLFGSDTDSTIRLGVRNALDEDAPLVWSTAGYEENVHDPRGRYIFLSLTTKF